MIRLILPVGAFALFALPALAAIQEGRSTVIAPVAALTGHAVSDTIPGLWSLNAEYRGDGYNLDWNMTLEDCQRDVPDNQPEKALWFSCDRQP